MDLGEAIYREIAGKSSRTEVHSFRDALDYLVGQHGSASAAARAIGVPPSSMRHWVSSGRRPKDGRAGIVTRAATMAQRRARLPAGREKKLRRDDALAGVQVSGIIIVSDKEEERTLDVGRYMDEVQHELVDAFLDGASTSELSDIFTDAVHDAQFYTDALDGTYNADFTDLDGWR